VSLTGTNREPISSDLGPAALLERNDADARCLYTDLRGCFSRGAQFPAKSRKIPCSEGILASASGLRCFLLHFRSGIEEHQRVAPDLFQLRGRAPPREVGLKWATGSARLR